MPAPVNVASGLVAPEQNSFSRRVGRQEIAFGDERLFSIREGTSLRFTYDAIRATLRLKPFVRYSFDRHTALTLNDPRFNAGAFIVNPTPIGESVDSSAAAVQIKC